jgi:hypothetical protein
MLAPPSPASKGADWVDKVRVGAVAPSAEAKEAALQSAVASTIFFNICKTFHKFEKTVVYHPTIVNMQNCKIGGDFT